VSLTVSCCYCYFSFFSYFIVCFCMCVYYCNVCAWHAVNTGNLLTFLLTQTDDAKNNTCFANNKCRKCSLKKQMTTLCVITKLLHFFGNSSNQYQNFDQRFRNSSFCTCTVQIWSKTLTCAHRLP